MKTCTKCGKEKDLDAFRKKGSGLDARCRVCQAGYHMEWYAANRERRIAQVSAAVDRSRENRRAAIAELKNVPCADCGHRFHHAAMDFDHVRGTKEFSIGEANRIDVSSARLIEEIAKCEIVCANCHRVRTFNRFHGTIAQ